MSNGNDTRVSGSGTPYITETINVKVGNDVVPALRGDASPETLTQYRNQMVIIAALFNSENTATPADKDSLTSAIQTLQTLSRTGAMSYEMCRNVDLLLKAKEGAGSLDVATFKTYIQNQKNAEEEASKTGKVPTPFTTLNDFLNSSTALGDVKDHINYQTQSLSSQLMDFVGTGNEFLAKKLGGLKSTLEASQKATDALAQLQDKFTGKTPPKEGDVVPNTYPVINYKSTSKLLELSESDKKVINSAERLTAYIRYVTEGDSKWDAMAKVLLHDGTFTQNRLEQKPIADGPWMTVTSSDKDNSMRRKFYDAVYGNNGKATLEKQIIFTYDDWEADKQKSARDWVKTYLFTPAGLDRTTDGKSYDATSEISPVVAKDTTRDTDVIRLRAQLKTAYDGIETPVAQPTQTAADAMKGSLKEKLYNLLYGTSKIPEYASEVQGWIEDASGDNQRSLAYATTAAISLNDKKKQEISASMSQFQSWQQMCMSAIQILQQIMQQLIRGIK